MRKSHLSLSLLIVVFVLFVRTATSQQPVFAVATIRPSVEAVQFEHDGRTEISPESLRMKDVTVNTCIKWAYGIQDSQILGPSLLRSDRYDITAKSDSPAAASQMKLMLQNLLADRFKLTFHRENKNMKAAPSFTPRLVTAIRPARIRR
jgi:uncharacterized protein (TIGR03435 family)